MTIITAKTTAVLTAIFLLFCTNELKAQYELILSGGIAVPRKPKQFRQTWNKGYNLAAELIFPYDDSGFIFSVDLNFMSFSMDKQKILEFNKQTNEAISLKKNNKSVVTVMGNLTAILPLDGNATVNFFVGLGIFRLHSKVVVKEVLGVNDTSVFETSETKVGTKLGAGLEIPVNRKNSIVLIAQYFIGFTDGRFHHIIPIKIGWRIKK